MDAHVDINEELLADLDRAAQACSIMRNVAVREGDYSLALSVPPRRSVA